MYESTMETDAVACVPLIIGAWKTCRVPISIYQKPAYIMENGRTSSAEIPGIARCVVSLKIPSILFIMQAGGLYSPCPSTLR